MKKQYIEGYAVVAPSFTKDGKRTHRVIGVGQWPPSAWQDAAEKETNGRLDGGSLQQKHPQYQTLNAKITVTFDPVAELLL